MRWAESYNVWILSLYSIAMCPNSKHNFLKFIMCTNNDFWNVLSKFILMQHEATSL